MTREHRAHRRTAAIACAMLALVAAGVTGHGQAFAVESWRGLVVAPENRCAPYRGHRGRDCRTLSAEQMDRCLAIAAKLHPAWHRCSPASRKLHARNAAILGAGTREPVHAVVAWSVGGAATGVTGMSIRIAQAHDIPVLNLGVLHARAVCRRLEEIRRAAAPRTHTASVPERGGEKRWEDESREGRECRPS